jgi:YidC/Oxa1 family membrane protein insertase
MDRKSIIILAAAILLLMGLSPVVDHFFPPKLVPVVPTNQLSTATGGMTNGSVPTVVPPLSRAPVVPEGSPETTLTVSNADVVYYFTSHGGGVKQIDLNEYRAVTRRSAQVKVPSRPASLNTGAAIPIGALVSQTTSGGDDYSLSRQGNIVRAEKMLPGGIHVVKDFDFGTNYAFNGSDLGAETNHLFTVHLRFENTTQQPQTVPPRELIVGTSAPVGPLDDPTTLGTFWYNGAKAQNIKDTWFANRTLIFFPGTPRTQYREGAGNVDWVAPHNQFFALAAIPAKPAPEVVIDKAWLPPPDTNGVEAKARFVLTNGFQSSLAYPSLNLAPGQTAESVVTYYAGPKEYKVLAKLGQDMGNNLDLIMDFTGPSGFFSKGLLICMNALHATGLGYGGCIIAITLIIKGLFWPLTASAARSQKRLQALQPQLKAIAEKYKDDAGKKNEKTMEFMKQNKVNPMGSCLPTLLQLPVFIGFYYMLRNAIELRGVHFLWAYDLSQPDTVFYVAGFPVNPLPLIMGATQFWQMHMTPPSPGMDPGQQKIMKLMPLMMMGIFYKMSAGLTVYWTVSNLLGILQMKVTRATADAPKPGSAPAPVLAKKKK